MSIISLTFQLHCPILDAANFQQNNQACYQPLFALLERNVQKYADFRAALVISGPWLDQAEKYDPELITRLKKLIASHKVELIASPYYHSLAFFYDPAEFEAEVWLCQERFRELFDIECPTFAHTDFIYNDQIGQWVSANGFQNILIGASVSTLGQYSTNHLYDVAGKSANTKILCRHTELSDHIMFDFDSLRQAKTSDSVQYFNKLINKSSLWGNIINLVLDAEIFRQHRSAGIIQFLDALILAWLQNPHYQLVNPANISQFDDTQSALSIKNTVSWWDELTSAYPHRQPGLVRSRDFVFQPPQYLQSLQQHTLQQQLYQLKPQIFRTEDEDLINDFCTKTSIDYLYDSSDNYLMRSWISEARNHRPLSQNLTQAISDLNQRLLNWQAEQRANAIAPQVIKNTNHPEDSKISPESANIPVKIIKNPKRPQPTKTTAQDKNTQEHSDDFQVAINFTKKNTTKNPTQASPISKNPAPKTSIQDAISEIDNEPSTKKPQTRSSRQIRWKLVIE